MSGCARCRQAARIAREAYHVGQDLGMLYGIVTGKSSTAVSTTTRGAMDEENIIRSRTGKRVARGAKREVTRYQKEFGKQLKKLKKNHPRTHISRLMKRAHRDTKKMGFYIK